MTQRVIVTVPVKLLKSYEEGIENGYKGSFNDFMNLVISFSLKNS